ncbi:MAG: hypothetical protein V8T36_08015 [Ruthenibacterium lactatiformans]
MNVTGAMKAENELVVDVTNEECDVYPQRRTSRFTAACTAA